MAKSKSEGRKLGHTIALFGEAAKGEFRTAYFCHSLPQLSETFGEPPHDSRGIDFAIKTLLFDQEVIYFRVHEEGYSIQDYLLGLNFLENKELFPYLSAICLPGVGNKEIIEATSPICIARKTFLIITQSDLYDFLTY